LSASLLSAYTSVFTSSREVDFCVIVVGKFLWNLGMG